MKKDKTREEFLASGWVIIHEEDRFGSLRELEFGRDFFDGGACVSLTVIDDNTAIWSASIVVRLGRERVSETIRIHDFGSVNDLEAFVMERATAMRSYAMGRVSEIDLAKPPIGRFPRA